MLVCSHAYIIVIIIKSVTNASPQEKKVMNIVFSKQESWTEILLRNNKVRLEYRKSWSSENDVKILEKLNRMVFIVLVPLSNDAAKIRVTDINWQVTIERLIVIPNYIGCYSFFPHFFFFFKSQMITHLNVDRSGCGGDGSIEYIIIVII